MTVHTASPGEDLDSIRARLELDDEAILHIGAAGAIHFDDAAEQDKYDDRVLDEAKMIKRKRNPEWYAKLVARNQASTAPRGRPRVKGVLPKEKGGSE